MDKLVRQQALSPAEKDEKTRPMEKEKRNYVEELENLKTTFIGYDKEAVLDYIQSLFDALEEEQQQAVSEISKRNLALAVENAAMKSEIQTCKQVYEELVKRVDQLNLSMDASMDKMGSYAKESANALETYRRREQEIAVKEQAASAQREAILREANAEAARIKAAAAAEAETILVEAKASKQRVLKETETRIDAILKKAETKTQKERAQYAYYRQCLRNYCEHLEAYLDETEQQTASKHTETEKTQEIPQQTVQPEADAEQISKPTETEQG